MLLMPLGQEHLSIMIGFNYHTGCYFKMNAKGLQSAYMTLPVE
jgi:hypothetical protein